MNKQPVVFEVIATFWNSGQEIFTVNVAPDASQPDVLLTAMLFLSAQERHDLAKLSFCQMGGEKLSWLDKAPDDHKYYFAEYEE